MEHETQLVCERANLGEVVQQFRRRSIEHGLHYTLRLISLTRGSQCVDRLLAAYFRETSPDLFVAVECDGFARYVYAHEPEATRGTLLAQVLAFEHALVRASLRGESTQLTWHVNPDEVFEDLDANRVPRAVTVPAFSMTIGR
jgi:uncharacterized protein